jgi:hypothetical protein
MMLDITTKKVVETALIPLTDAEEAPLMGEGDKQCSIEVHGPGSAAYARAEAKKNNRTIDRLKKKGKATASAEEQRGDQADFLADITIAFHGFTYPPAGEATGRDLFRALYMDRSVGFITDQVQSFVGDWGNFTGKSSTN